MRALPPPVTATCQEGSGIFWRCPLDGHFGSRTRRGHWGPARPENDPTLKVMPELKATQGGSSVRDPPATRNVTPELKGRPRVLPNRRVSPNVCLPWQNPPPADLVQGHALVPPTRGFRQKTCYAGRWQNTQLPGFKNPAQGKAGNALGAGANQRSHALQEHKTEGPD
jgi:hypothetical protein